jgi:hypothetical protein
MNRRIAVPVFVLLAVISGCFVAAPALRLLKHIEKRGPAPERVSAILPGDLDATAGRIETVFNRWSEFERPGRTGAYPNKFSRASQWSHFFLSRRDDTGLQLFPSDEEIGRNRGVDSFILAYLRIPNAKRGRDFYFREPSGDYYWDSEYFYNSAPAKFYCSFLIHLEPSDASHTTVEIFEYQPYIWAGEYIGFSAHAILPTTLHDIRPVEPTTSDRRALLALIGRSASAHHQAGTQ